MTLPSSGPISFLDIQNEFGGSNPIGLNEYYRGGAYVPSGTSAGTGSFQDTPLPYAAPVQIATSGAIQASMFRGTTAVTPFVLNYTIATDTIDFVMRATAIAEGWDTTSPLIMTVTVNPGVMVSASSFLFYAFRTRTGSDPVFPVGSTLALINYGIIAGAGGLGGGGGSVLTVSTFTSGISGVVGGNALLTYDNISITNYGAIAAGGGGGGGGGASVTSTGTGKTTVETGHSGGGGGGGRAVLPGAATNAGIAGSVATGGTTGIDAVSLGTSGASGTKTGVGAGGTPRGGAGGWLGKTGEAGTTVVGGGGAGAGGVAGTAITESGGSITWVRQGTVYSNGSETGVVNVTSGQWGLSVYDPDAAITAVISFNNNGTVDYLINSSITQIGANWFSPTTTGIGPYIWMRMTKTSGDGTVTGSPLGTWIQAFTAPAWQLSVPAGSSTFFGFTMEFSFNAGIDTIISYHTNNFISLDALAIGEGGSGSGSGACPAPWHSILLSDGTTIGAGSLKPGMFVRTQHETTLETGDYEVEAVEIHKQERMLVKFENVDFVCSLSHKFHVEGDKWIHARQIEPGMILSGQRVISTSDYEFGEVVKISVKDARTYICEGLLSHNVKLIYETV